jgi:ABC-type Fe3+ transport system permease subunit
VEEQSVATAAHPKNRNNSLRKQMKLVKTGFIVCSSWCVCWLPYFIVLSIEVFVPGMETERTKTIRAGTVFLLIFNSVLNPLIYTFRLPVFQREVRTMLRLKYNYVHELR